MSLALAIAAQESALKLKELDQVQRDRKSAAPKSLTVATKPRPARHMGLTAIPEGVTVTRVDPGVARGLEPVRMRAKGERGSESREPGAMTRKEKLEALEGIKNSLTPSVYLAAKARIMGKK